MCHNCFMKRAKPEMLPEYDFTGAARGKYAGRFANGYTVRVEKGDGTMEETRYTRLAPDLAAAFPTDEAVSAALREWLQDRQASARVL